MKHIYQYFLCIFLVAMAFASCQKTESLPFYESGVGSALTLSTNAVTLSAANATQGVVSFSWTDPGFATDTANFKYVVEIAPKGSSFANPLVISQLGGTSLSVIGSQLNNALVAWGKPFATAADLEVRLKSSYANNNDMKTTPVTELKVTPYAVPFTLSASATGTFSPTPQTKDDILTKLSWTAPSYGTSTVSYVLQYAKAGTSFASTTDIAIDTDSLARSLSGLTIYQMANNVGIALNATGGVDVRIKAVVNKTGQVSYSTTQTLTVKPLEMTLYMYVAGDFQKFNPYMSSLPSGNNWGWEPSVAPRIASENGVTYEGYIWVAAGGTFEFKIAAGPNWDVAYGGDATTLSTSGGNLKFPTSATGAYYLLKVNMNTKAWTVTKTDWGLIGDATPGGWDNSTNMTYNSTTGKWTATVTMKSGLFKFRANNNWDLSLGSGSNGFLTDNNGGNLVITAGTKTITLDLSNPLKYTYSVQ